MNFISSYIYIIMYITFIRFFFNLEVLLFYGGGCDGVGECSVKGALGVTRWRSVCVGGGVGGGKVCIGSAMQKRGWVKMGRGV